MIVEDSRLQIEDDPVLELVLPVTGESASPFAEERRLFYVAMTRARRGVYLVTDPIRPSAFVCELLASPAIFGSSASFLNQIRLVRDV